MQLHPADSLRSLFASLVFPQICIVCGKETSTAAPLCASCLERRFLPIARRVSFLREDDSRCRKCGRPLVSTGGLCTECRTVASLQSIDRIIPLYPYTPWGQELLSVWKLSGMRGFSRVYAGLLAVALGGTGPGCTVVPVPPRPGKIREKGWDQVEDLVRILEREHGIGVTRCLWRTARIQQKRLGRAGRVMNLRGHVSARPGFPVPETGILIDDLMTTGATLDSCAEALKSAGCRTVWGLTLFYD